MACIYFENEAHFNFISRIEVYSHASLETYGMAPGPRLLLSPCNINHHSIPAPWSCLFVSRLSSPLALPAWHSANLVWHLLLRMGWGRGTQAGFQFFHELGAVCSQQTVKPCSKGFRGPQHGGAGHWAMGSVWAESAVESKLASGIESCWYKLLVFFSPLKYHLSPSACFLTNNGAKCSFVCLELVGLFLHLTSEGLECSAVLFPEAHHYGFSVFCV